jgi:hypothetical protein
MATAATILGDWASLDPEKETLYAHTPSLMLRWLNEAQLRFCNKSEILQGVWQPTVPSTGVIALPTDFLREYIDKIQWTTNQYLRKGDYPTLKLLNLSSTMYYAIYDEDFYVLSAAAGSPTIFYIRKPLLLNTTIGSPQLWTTAELEIPTEYHSVLLGYLDAIWMRHKLDIKSYRASLDLFDRDAIDCGIQLKRRRDGFPTMRGSYF